MQQSDYKAGHGARLLLFWWALRDLEDLAPLIVLERAG